MKVLRNLIFCLFSMLLMGAGHFAFANQENIQDVHLDEVVITAKRKTTNPQSSIANSPSAVPRTEGCK